MKLAQRRNDILDSLAQLEKEHNISILYACESGSRAWVLLLLIVTMMFVLSMCISQIGTGI